ncbi:hypothetical protein [Sulfobacillus sp. hq2]|uniref:hypothetical protein n=1 Tax=Sulfobacillus TaxID=28033 RepID=UPI000CD02E66|nr:hypothetical protein [Sulfobacillus sp. hq2]POB11411.1 hypothetical protein CO251_04510 [Sulfobacillus sp. hq2]
MRGVRLSRWSMTYFTVAVICLILAQGVWASGDAQPLQNIGSAWVLVSVHLTTIGFLTILMIGALHQFVPVLTETELVSQTWSGITLAFLTLGLVGMVAGFLAIPGQVPGGVLPNLPWLLPSGGTLVVLGVIVALLNLGLTLKRAWPWTLPAWLVATGLGYLLLTVLAGLTFAVSFADPKLFPASWLVVMGGRGLAAHVIGGVGGWLTLTAMGVSYKLLSMFTLSNEHRGAAGWIGYIATALGILGVWWGRWMGANQWPTVAWIVMLMGLSFYLWDMRVLYQQRKRRQLELNSRYVTIALTYLGVVIIAATVVQVSGSLRRIDIALTYLALYGWLGGLALTQLYKIIPFLTWLNHYGTHMGKGRVPRVQDLVNERRDRYGYVIYFMAVLLGSVWLAVGWFNGFRVVAAITCLASLDIARALYHAAHPKMETGNDAQSPIPQRR